MIKGWVINVQREKDLWDYDKSIKKQVMLLVFNSEIIKVTVIMDEKNSTIRKEDK